jgi:hypothetical protein
VVTFSLYQGIQKRSYPQHCFTSLNASHLDVHLDYSDSKAPPCEDYLYSDPDCPIEVLVYDQR